MRDLRIWPTPSDGSCMFHAVAYCLSQYRGVLHGELRDRLRGLGMPAAEELTAAHLRALVYTLFLVPGEDTDLWLTKWQMMYSVDPREYAHAAVLAGKVIAELTPHDRLTLVRQCLKLTTWGDEISLVILELLLGLRIMVLADNRMQTRPNAYGSFYPDLYLVLRLSAGHYEAVYWSSTASGRSVSAFAECELPGILVTLAHRDCGAASEPYVNLAHLEPAPNGLASMARPRSSPSVLDPGAASLAAKIRAQYLRVLGLGGAAGGDGGDMARTLSAGSSPPPVPLQPPRSLPTYRLDGGDVGRPRPVLRADGVSVASALMPVKRLQCGMVVRRPLGSVLPAHSHALFSGYRPRPFVLGARVR